MSILSSLRQEAEQIAQTMQARIGELSREIQQKSAERARLIDEKNHAALAAQRCEKYPVLHGSKIVCPYCWVARGQLSELAIVDPSHEDPTQRGSSQEGLRCENCAMELRSDPVSHHAPDAEPMFER